MSVRIYVLAKRLGLDSKELLSLCKEAGVEVKSSALAILSDEECAQVEQYFKTRSTKAEPAPGPSAGKSSAPEAPIKPEDYVPASGVARKPPTLSPSKPAKSKAEQPPSAEQDSGDREKKPTSRPRPRLAAPPAMKREKAARRETQEPAPQKPDLRLPPDAIRAGAGSKPLEEHIRKHEKKKRADTTARPRGPMPPEPPDRPSRAGPLAGREARQRRRGRRALERQRQQAEERGVLEEEATERPSAIRRRMGSRSSAPATVPRKGKAVVESPVTVRSLSEATGIASQRLIGTLMKMGTLVTINSALDDDLAQMLSMEFGVELEVRAPRDAEQEMLSRLEQDAAEARTELRPPVVTLLGHVDHGKTSLLDAIRETNVVAGEAGGITQHIGAYQIQRDSKRVTFVDTPGHEAFTEMRARGANVTDIAVLVVAADDGLMPQTEEAISHAKAANVPIVVALNKIDLPSADVPRVLQQLAAHELLPTQWGGDTEVIETSAVNKTGIDDLIETLITLAELRELKADPDSRAVGTCLEASLSEGRGVMATLLVQNGTLRLGDVILCGDGHGRVKAMYDDRDGAVEQAGPSVPVKLAGLDVVPAAGDRFYALDDLAVARRIAEGRKDRQRQQVLAERRHISLDDLYERVKEEEVGELRIILKADTRGSIEAIKQEFDKLEHPEVQCRLLHQGVGGVNESDVLLADASDAIIVAFQVAPDERARALADEKGVEIRRYDIVYQVTDDIRKALEGLLAPELREAETGRAIVLQVFHISRLGSVAGCRVLQGTIERSARIRVIRDGKVLNHFPIASLRHKKDDVREVREGYECGIKLAGFDDVKEGDTLECFRVEEVKRTL